ncbi:DASS family sodium-coupled anion symporter [Sporohalobacter salinus]|uniref:DASS family sodium-coupled anion symporter n=1 Tax=Sporohalobacter salinus TaxID=1494606 RepID=UPI00196028E1|nr:sodium-dependent dicarboxylate transporter 2/3/5 [Sporohalobacter salinus]
MFGQLKRLIAACGILFFIVILLLPSPEGLSIAGKNSFAVFVLCLSLWISQMLPLSVTGLLGIALMPLLNILGVEETFALFGNKAIFFILGALILAAGIYQTGLGTRIASKIIGTFGKSPRQLLVGILLSSGFLSCIMPEHAVAALLFPIVLEVATILELKPLESNYGKLLFFAMAWGAIVGGITTFLGGARNLLAVGLLEKQYNISIGFFEWIKYSWPMPALLLAIISFMMTKVFEIDISNIDKADQELKKRLEKAGEMSIKEKKLSVVLFIVICSWLFLSQIIDISVIAILGGVLTFVAGIVEWQDIEDYINWSVLLMYGGAIVVATSLVKTGATEWLSEIFFAQLELSPFIFLVCLVIFTNLLTEGVSNVAAVAIVLPLAYSIGEAYSINPIIITLSVALPGGLAFMLPMGTPPNAIAFSSGFYRVQDAVKFGIMLDIIAWLVYILVAKFYWPLIGLQITL